MNTAKVLKHIPAGTESAPALALKTAKKQEQDRACEKTAKTQSPSSFTERLVLWLLILLMFAGLMEIRAELQNLSQNVVPIEASTRS